MIDPAETNETYRAASAIAAFDAIQVAFAALVKKGILSKAEAEHNNMKPYGGLTSAEDRARGDYILGVAHDQLSGYVALPIQRGRISSRLSGNRGSAWGSSHAALHRRVSSFGREVRLLSLR